MLCSGAGRAGSRHGALKCNRAQASRSAGSVRAARRRRREDRGTNSLSPEKRSSPAVTARYRARSLIPVQLGAAVSVDPRSRASEVVLRLRRVARGRVDLPRRGTSGTSRLASLAECCCQTPGETPANSRRRRTMPSVPSSSFPATMSSRTCPGSSQASTCTKRRLLWRRALADRRARLPHRSPEGRRMPREFEETARGRSTA